MPLISYLFSGSFGGYRFCGVSIVACLFEYGPMGVWFTKCKQPVRDLPVAKASTVVVVVTVLPKDLEYHEV